MKAPVLRRADVNRGEPLQRRVPARKRDAGMTDKASSCRMTVTEVDEFLRKPPAGFSVEDLDPGCRVLGDPEKSLVLIEDFDSCRGRIVFENSLGRWVGAQWHGGTRPPRT